MPATARSAILFLLLIAGLHSAAAPANGQAVIFVSASAGGAGDGSSWADAYTSVQTALDAATNGVQVWVAAGAYVENITLVDGVALYGGFAGTEDPATFDLADRDFAAHETILDGNQTGSVVTGPVGATEVTGIDGFTIINGIGTVLAGIGSCGGGIYLFSSSPTIANNRIIGNDADVGGGVCLASSSPPLLDNAIINNGIGFPASQGGGIALLDSVADITRCTIAGNRGMKGGGLYAATSTGQILDSIVTANNEDTYHIQGGGMAVFDSTMTIRGCTLAQNLAVLGGGLYGERSALTISTCAITWNRGYAAGGGLALLDSPAVVANNVICNNTALESGIWSDVWHGGGGVALHASYVPPLSLAEGQQRNALNGPMLINNTLVGNYASRGGAISSNHNIDPIIINSIIAHNSSGIYWLNSSNPTRIRYNCFFENALYDYNCADCIGPVGTAENFSADPRLTGQPYGNYHLQCDSPCIDAGSNGVATGEDFDRGPRIWPENGTVDIGADEFDGTLWPSGPPVIVRVSPAGDDANDGASWTAPKQTVQAAIDAAAADGGDVWVQAGTYLERITLLPFTHVYGGFAGNEMVRSERDWQTNATVLDGERQGSVVTVQAGYRISTIDGFTITHGDAFNGGGLLVWNASPTIAHNTIIDNRASFDGGGIWLSSFWPIVTHSAVKHNFAGQRGGGLYIEGSISPDGQGIIGDTLIVGNRARFGGGMYILIVKPDITNSIMAGNAAAEGGALYLNSYPSITNTIIAFNASGIYRSSATSAALLRHSCVYGNTAYDVLGIPDPTGTLDNISEDPRFMLQPSAGPDRTWATTDDIPGDFHLLPGSPAVDAGSNGYVLGDSDSNGRPRILDGNFDGAAVVDMGAFELILGDIDHSGHVDLDDYPPMGACLIGPQLPVQGPLARQYPHDRLTDELETRSELPGSPARPDRGMGPGEEVPQGEGAGESLADDGFVLTSDDHSDEMHAAPPSPPGAISPNPCAPADLDGDDDVDLEDFRIFQVVFGRP